MMRDDWIECRLGEVCHTTSGGTPSRKKEQFYNGCIPWVKSGELNYNIIIKAEEHITEEAIKKSSAKIFPKGSILIALYGATIGKLAFLGIDAAPNQAVCAIFKNKIFESNFLFNYLFHKRRNLIEQGTGGAQPNISQTILKKLILPVAPLPEQRAIVAKIEELFSSLDNGISDLNKASAQLKIYRQAVLKKAFTGELTKEWRSKQTSLPTANELLQQIQTERQNHHQQLLTKWQETVQLWEDGGKEGRKPMKPRVLKELPPLTEEEIAILPPLPEVWAHIKPQDIASPENYSIGIGPFGSNLKVSDYQDFGVPLIFVRNITRNNFFLNQKFISQDKYRELTAYSVKPLDILITKMGDPPGDCSIYPQHQPNAVITSDCLKFRVWSKYSERLYFKYCIESIFIKKQLGYITKGVAQKKISAERFKTLNFPLCSLPEQLQIVQEIESRLSVCDNIEQTISASLEKAEGLRQSILKKAFAGELLSATALAACRKEADWQPASELLKQIKAAQKDA